MMCYYDFIFQKNLDDLEHKFRKFQKPADFEPKMAHVKGILENVKEGIGVIELKNGEPEIIQTQLDACMVSRGVKGMFSGLAKGPFILHCNCGCIAELHIHAMVLHSVM